MRELKAQVRKQNPSEERPVKVKAVLLVPLLFFILHLIQGHKEIYQWELIT